MYCPTLAVVPPSHRSRPKIKATISGITYLKGDTEYRTRYTGNKFSAVDINGNLWVKASELKKQKEIEYWQFKGKPVPGKAKKKVPVETATVSNNVLINESDANYRNLSTPETQTGSYLQEFSTDTAQPKGYTVNKKEVRQRILGFINTQRGKKQLYFWTVTFPKGTPDEIAYQMFNIWLTSLRQKRMLKNYVWVAERQQNETVHFHLAIPHTMSVKGANGMMRTTLKTFVKRGLILWSLPRCRGYNGIDIAKNRKTRRVTNFALKKGSRALTTYLTKYVTKNDTKFSHLAWHNSRGYSAIFTGVTFTVEEFYKFGFNKVLHFNRAKWFDTDYFTFIPWFNGPPAALEIHLFQVNTYLQECLESLN